MKYGESTFDILYLLILLSFLFYIPLAVAAGLLPVLGMLMLPKTVCHILIIVCFLRAVKNRERTVRR